jgi:hypothetical protein
MKAITIWQPWASLIALGLKINETRGWATKYRGEIAIHAAKKIVPVEQFLDGLEGLNFLQKSVIIDKINQEYGSYNTIPTGAIVATGILSDVQPTEMLREKITPLEMAYGDYSDNRFGWTLKDVKKLSMPIVIKGQQGLWNWDGDGN